MWKGTLFQRMSGRNDWSGGEGRDDGFLRWLRPMTEGLAYGRAQRAIAKPPGRMARMRHSRAPKKERQGKKVIFLYIQNDRFFVEMNWR